jgi:hypothetical protein
MTDTPMEKTETPRRIQKRAKPLSLRFGNSDKPIYETGSASSCIEESGTGGSFSDNPMNQVP